MTPFQIKMVPLDKSGLYHPRVADHRDLISRKAGFLFGVAAGLALLVGVYSAFYTVDVGHQGVVLRFGQHVDTTNPGLHFKMPFGIDRVISVPVEFQQTLEFGFRTLQRWYSI